MIHDIFGVRKFYSGSSILVMKRNKRQPKKPRNLDILGMILGRKAKSWDSRDRRSKDTRNDPVRHTTES